MIAPSARRPFAHAARALVRRFLRRREGTTAVEFGLVALPFFAVLAAVFETGYVHLENELLQGALAHALRQITTGQMQLAGITDPGTFKSTYLCQAQNRTLSANFDCSKLIIAMAPVTTFQGADMSKGFYRNASNPFCPASPGQITMVKVAYPLGAIFPLNLFNRNVGLVNDVPGRPGWVHLLMGSGLFQVENFTGAYAPPNGC